MPTANYLSTMEVRNNCSTKSTKILHFKSVFFPADEKKETKLSHKYARCLLYAMAKSKPTSPKFRNGRLNIMHAPVICRHSDIKLKFNYFNSPFYGIAGKMHMNYIAISMRVTNEWLDDHLRRFNNCNKLQELRKERKRQKSTSTASNRAFEARTFEFNTSSSVVFFLSCTN